MIKPIFSTYFRPVPGKGNGNVSDIKVFHCFLFHKRYNLFANRVDKPSNIVLTFSISTPDRVNWWLDLARLGAREPTNWQWVKSKKIVSEKTVNKQKAKSKQAKSKQAKRETRKQVNKQKGNKQTSKKETRKDVNKQKGNKQTSKKETDPCKYILNSHTLAARIFTKNLGRVSILKFDETEVKRWFHFDWYCTYMTLFLVDIVWHYFWLIFYDIILLVDVVWNYLFWVDIAYDIIFGWYFIWHYIILPIQHRSFLWA